MRNFVLILLLLLLYTPVAWADHNILHIYVDHIDLGACPNATTKTVAHGVPEGIDMVLPLSGVIREDAAGVAAPFSQAVSGGAYDYWEIDTTIGGLITIGSNVDRSTSNCSLLLYYTKP